MFAIVLQCRDDDSEVVACSPDLDRLRLEYWNWVRHYANYRYQWGYHPTRNPITYGQALQQTMRWVQLIEVKEV